MVVVWWWCGSSGAGGSGAGNSGAGGSGGVVIWFISPLHGTLPYSIL